MFQVTEFEQCRLPDRKEITLCEAVTAFAWGKFMGVFDFDLEERPPTQEQKDKVTKLIEGLQSAAYAGRITLRALRTGDDEADIHRAIDNLYFRRLRGFRWERDDIWSRGPSLRNPNFEERPGCTEDWRDVHVDRMQFEELLRDIGVPIAQHSKSGMPGRPTSKYLILKMAEDRLNAGMRPTNLSQFAKQLAKDLSIKHPGAVPVTDKTVMNAVRGLYNSYKRRPNTIDRS
jgi:hypothetical protein